MPSSILHVSAFRMDEKNRTEPMLLGMVCAAGTRRRCPAVSASFDQQSGLGGSLAPSHDERVVSSGMPTVVSEHPPDATRQPPPPIHHDLEHRRVFGVVCGCA